MKSLLAKAKSYWIIIAVIVVIVLIAGYFFWNSKNGNGQETLTIQPTEFTQTVSVSGKVIPAKSVALGFNQSGKITNVPVVVGQAVAAGQIIAEIDSRDAKLSLEKARLALDKLTETNNSTQGLAKSYDDSLASVNSFFIDLSPVLEGLDLILNNYTVSLYKNNLPNNIARDKYRLALTSYEKAKRAYDQALQNFQKLGKPATNDDVAKITEEVYQVALASVQATKDSYSFVNYLYNQESNPISHTPDLVTDRTNINNWISIANTSLSDLSAKRSNLKDVPLDIRSQELAIKQYENDYENCFVRAPFSGVITQLDVKPGEIATVGEKNILMISSGLFQIESFVPEINIANLKVGNPAEVTLDAYGSSVPFSAQVISIDPAETIHDGVSTYKVKLQFSAIDARIKPGMTANLLITALKKPNVISVPASAITEKAGKKFVNLLTNGQTSEVEITTGQIGFLGQTEVLTGLRPGDQIVLKSQSK